MSVIQLENFNSLYLYISFTNTACAAIWIKAIVALKKRRHTCARYKTHSGKHILKNASLLPKSLTKINACKANPHQFTLKKDDHTFDDWRYN
jgi:hypothetical protein